ncbi:hypothetical protein [Nostoc sp. MG11]|uniref:hypothetical protein n=1 Tax=Nostoc sp. MG11 TaxID=2721166 RepID=UPI001865EA2E|nr:hypothetical protein [Nostoc sp. MG11]
MMTQISAPAQTKDPLTSRDRRIIATIVNESDYPHDCQIEDVVTIWINSDDIVWVKMTHGYARYHKDLFKAAVAELKETLPETHLERNERLEAELEQACTKFGLSHAEIDWLSFSTTVYRDSELVGFVGCNWQGWYSNPRKLGVNRIAQSAIDAIAFLGVRPALAA